MSVYLELHHGRTQPDVELDGWGFDGPVLGPFPYIHQAYFCNMDMGDETILVPKRPNTEIIIVQDMIKFCGSFYGDYSITSGVKLEKSLYQRYLKTKRVMKADPPLLMGDTDQWVQNYVAYILKGD